MAELRPVQIGQGWADLEVVGEAYHQASIAALLRSWKLDDGGVKNTAAVLMPEPTNRHDADAVKVLIENHTVGYVDGESAPAIGGWIRSLGPGTYAYTPARVWAKRIDGDLKARVTLNFSGKQERERDFAAEARTQAQTDAVRAAGSVGDHHWTVFKGEVKALIGQQRFDEAVTRLEACLAAACREGVAGGVVPAAWPVEQLALIHRKRKDQAAELNALERYALACGVLPLPDKVAQRLLALRVERR